MFQRRVYCLVLLLQLLCFPVVAESSVQNSSLLPLGKNLSAEVETVLFSDMAERDQLRNWIEKDTPEFKDRLDGSEWFVLTFPSGTLKTSDWLQLNLFLQNRELVIIQAIPNTDFAHAISGKELLETQPLQGSFWFNSFAISESLPTKVYFPKQWAGKTFKHRKVRLLSNDEKQAFFSFYDIFYAVYIGAAIALLLNGGFLAIRLGSLVHGIYACLVLGFTVFFLFDRGLIVHLLPWINPPAELFDLVLLSVAGFFAPFALFTVFFLEPKHRLKILVVPLVFSVTGLFAIPLLPLALGIDTDFLTTMKFYDLFGITGVLLWLALLATAVIRKSRFAYYLLLGQSPLILLSLLRITVPDGNFLLQNSFQIGALIEAFILTYALSERVRIIRDESLAAKEEAEAREQIAIRKMNEKLESEVLQRTQELQQEKERAENLARTDVLTDLYNRRAFFEFSRQIIAIAKREERPFAVLMIDIDNFKNINDSFGHAVGDNVIQHTANQIVLGIREGDLAARIGGEEFAVLMPYTAPDQAMVVAERIRTAIQSLELPLDGQFLCFTCSIGIAGNRNDEDNIEQVMNRADQALYRAKESGRNRSVADTFISSEVTT